MISMKCLKLCLSFAVTFFICAVGYGQVKPRNTGVLVTSREKTSAQDAAMGLDVIRNQIMYCEENLGKKFTEVDSQRMGADKGFKDFAAVVTFGLIATKYQEDYGDTWLAANNFYKDWKELEKCEISREKGLRRDGCFGFGSGPGDYNPLAAAIDGWVDVGAYSEALKHYQEYYDNTFLQEPVGKSRAQKVSAFREMLKSNHELQKEYGAFMARWRQIKKSAKSEVVRVLSPDIKNHEWFYSDKQEEVLKALDYYFKHKVRFMLEKALKHKDPVIAAKAKGYIEELAKGEKNETENKKL